MNSWAGIALDLALLARITLVQPEGALVRVVLRAPGGKWTTLWLEKAGDRWRLAQAYPVRSGEGGDFEEPSE